MALVPFPSSSPDKEPKQAPAQRDPDRRIELTDADEFEGAGGKMSFLEHLDELRTRLLHSVIGLGVGCVIAFIYLDEVFGFITKPMRDMLPPGDQLTQTEPTEFFMMYMKVGVLVGLIIASPWVLWQLWLFIAPGLYAHEKRFAIPFVFMATAFFLAGAAFSHYVAFPWTWKFFVDFTPEYVQLMMRLGPAFGLYVKMLLGFGAIFQMPTIVFFLARMGVVTARFLIRNFKYALLIISILGAVLSPGGDVVSQAMMAGPMVVLYGFSIIIAWAFGKRRSPA
jgi:sec-independent protein translocase protein TatC